MRMSSLWREPEQGFGSANDGHQSFVGSVSWSARMDSYFVAIRAVRFR